MKHLDKMSCPKIVLLKHYFDQTKGYEGEGPKHLTIMPLNITGGKSKEDKYLAIEQFCEENKIDIVFLQETHSQTIDTIQKSLAHTNTIAFEAINPQNSNKNGAKFKASSNANLSVLRAKIQILFRLHTMQKTDFEFSRVNGKSAIFLIA